MAGNWRGILVCPTCKGALDESSHGWSCVECGAEYPLVGEMPGMINWAVLPSQARQEMAGQDRHFAALPDKAVFKPALHPLYQRVRLQGRLAGFVAALGDGLPANATVHVACCGSGYEAEALTRAGYQVSASDLSAQALRAFHKRATTKGYQVPYLQADVTHLPFPEDTFDVAVTVEGLHHTADPEAALQELVRIARRRVALIEPYTGPLFRLLAGLGLAHRREYSQIKPTRLSGKMLNDMVAAHQLTLRQRRLYLDLPPGGLIGRLGNWLPAAYLLIIFTNLAELLLCPIGVGNKVLWVADLPRK